MSSVRTFRVCRRRPSDRAWRAARRSRTARGRTGSIRPAARSFVPSSSSDGARRAAAPRLPAMRRRPHPERWLRRCCRGAASGPYLIVRHPIYAGYLVTHAAFLVAHPTLWNLAVIAICDTSQILRTSFEERTLSNDETFWMRFPIDVVFVDSSGTVKKSSRSWRRGGWPAPSSRRPRSSFRPGR